MKKEKSKSDIYLEAITEMEVKIESFEISITEDNKAFNIKEIKKLMSFQLSYYKTLLSNLINLQKEEEEKQSPVSEATEDNLIDFLTKKIEDPDVHVKVETNFRIERLFQSRNYFNPASDFLPNLPAFEFYGVVASQEKSLFKNMLPTLPKWVSSREYLSGGRMAVRFSNSEIFPSITAMIWVTIDPTRKGLTKKEKEDIEATGAAGIISELLRDMENPIMRFEVQYLSYIPTTETFTGGIASPNLFRLREVLSNVTVIVVRSVEPDRKSYRIYYLEPVGTEQMANVIVSKTDAYLWSGNEPNKTTGESAL